MNLYECMVTALSNTFSMYYMAHSAHWNVKGDDFPSMHEFFGDIYTEVYGAIDPLAEHIRALGAVAPVSLDAICAYSDIEEMAGVFNTAGMVRSLANANARVLDCLKMAYETANGKYGLQNFLADRIDQHEKHAWMLSAYDQEDE